MRVMARRANVLNGALRSVRRTSSSIGMKYGGIRLNSSSSSSAGGSSSGGQEKSSGGGGGNGATIGFTLLALTGAGAGYYYYKNQGAVKVAVTGKTAENATFEDYQKVYDAIAKKLEDEDDYEDGSYGPVVLRLAWHSSGTYDKNQGDGGSGLGTMRFKKEASYPANAGLEVAKEFLQSIHDQFPWISYGDLYTLGGVAAVQELQGPTVRWRAGRIDKPIEKTTPDGRLPDGGQGAQHVRDVFYRMGFTDQEIVALIGAHALGRCHTDRSGFDGPWTFSPIMFTNDFYTLLLNEKWHVRKWEGPKQYQDDSSNSLMMLPADYAMVTDKEFKKYVEKYAKDADLWFKDFGKAFEKLLELGVEFDKTRPYWTFKSRNGL